MPSPAALLLLSGVEGRAREAMLLASLEHEGDVPRSVYRGPVQTARRLQPLLMACLALVLASGAAGCGGEAASSSTSSTKTTVSSEGPTAAAPLKAPATTPAEDASYLSDVTEADPSLATYEQNQGNVALRALLTDGSGFCALLSREGTVDKALVDLALGARSEESQTHLPLSVTTFNSIEAVALLTLCPSEQRLLPAATQAKVRALGSALAARATTPSSS